MAHRLRCVTRHVPGIAAWPVAAPVRRKTVAVDLSARAQDLADYIDHHHPKLGSRLMQLRFGGLRTIEPTPGVVAATVASGAGVGLALRRLAGRRHDGRVRLPLVPIGATGAAVSWLALWRWDSARWHRTRVMVVVDLPDDRLDELVDSLRTRGLDVQRWDRARRADGPNHGLACRLRELRQVNAALDEMTGAHR